MWVPINDNFIVDTIQIVAILLRGGVVENLHLVNDPF